MNNFEIMGQARIDAAEHQRVMAIAAARWLRTSIVRLIDAIGRYLPEGKSTPW